MYAVDYDGYASCVAVDDAYAKLIAQIVEQPYIVIAYEPYDFGAGVGHGGELSEEAHIAARHHRAVFEPVVEYVAQQIQPCGTRRYGLQEGCNLLFVLYAVGHVACSQVDVAQEVGESA